MQGKDSNRSGVTSFFTKLFRQQIFIPLAALVLLAVFNLIADPGFFKITLGYNSAGNPVLSGFLITILDSGSELAILAIGMTLVTAASGGQDISVGAAIAISGSVLLRVLCGTDPRPEQLQAPIIVAFLVSCLVAMLFGAFNGVLVAYFKIQPMIATLILYTAGRSDSHALLYCGGLYDYYRIGAEVYQSEALYAGSGDQCKFLPAEWSESGVYQVYFIRYSWALCGCGRADQSKPYFYYQLFGYCQRYRDGCDPGGSAGR